MKISSSKNRKVHLFMRGAGWAEHVQKRPGDWAQVGRITAHYAAKMGMDGAVWGSMDGRKACDIGRITSIASW